MKLKLTGLAGTALLLLSPVASAMSAVTQAVPVQADNTWDYDVDDPGLGDYDQLLQNAGPSDGIVDWYPTKEALGENPSAQVLVRQLIDLSIATNDKDSDARKVLFNDTTGNNANASYKDTYNKYSVALGFIAQILDFNNAKSGIGARLEQAAVASDNDPQDSDGTGVIRGRIIDDPSNKSLGHNISDVLGTAFFGNADDAYAQIYVNGYDNVAQNEANIIREATSSITIVAQSKSTGKKATAIFKLNNKTMPRGVEGYKVNNYIDNSVYALDNNNTDIAGLNMTTAPQSTIDSISFSKESTFWVDGNDGAGTIVVPRGTTAQQVAELISKRKLTVNNSLRETAPMKAVQAATTSGKPEGSKKIEGTNKTWADVSYSHVYEAERYNYNSGTTTNPFPEANPYMELNGSANYNQKNIYNFAPEVVYGVNGPNHKLDLGSPKTLQYREYNNVFNSNFGGKHSTAFAIPLPNSVEDPRIYTTSETPGADGWFGGGDHMIDTNKLLAGGMTTKSAESLPDADVSEGSPYDKSDAIEPNDSSLMSAYDKIHVAGIGDDPGISDYRYSTKSKATKSTNVGKVQHLFKQPKNKYLKESYDANHFVMNSPALQSNDVKDITNQIAQNGSFSEISQSGQIKKSFTYEAPASAWVYKSYDNPYSTVMSSAGAKTVDGKPLEDDQSNSTIQPQTTLDLDQPDNPNPDKNGAHVIELTEPTTNSGNGYLYPIKVKDTSSSLKYYFYYAVYNRKKPTDATSNLTTKKNLIYNAFNEDPDLKILLHSGWSTVSRGTLNKFGVFGSDGENPDSNVREAGYPTSVNGIYQILSGTMHKTTMNHPKLSIPNLNLVIDDRIQGNDVFYKVKVLDDTDVFVQTWDKNTRTKEKVGNEFVYTKNPNPLIYNKNVSDVKGNFDENTLEIVDSPNYESKYYLTGLFGVNDSTKNVGLYVLGDHIAQTSQSKRAYYNSNLYNNPKGAFSKTGSHKNNSRFFVSQDFSIGPVSTDMINDPSNDPKAGVTIDGEYYPYGVNDTTHGLTPEQNAEQILKLTAMYNDPTQNKDYNKVVADGDDASKIKNEFSNTGGDGNGYGTDGTGYKFVSIKDASEKQGVSEDQLANEVAKVTGKSVNDVKSIKWMEASLPRMKRNAGKARINVVIYDKAAVSAPTKQDTKPSFSTTDISGGNDPFNVNFRPYTTTYDDGAVLKAADVPQNFKNLLSKTLVAGNPDLIGSTAKLQQILVSTFLDSWQQNDGSFKQTDTGAGVNSPLYLYGGFGISNSDTKNSYAQWPKGYTDNSGEYNTAITNHQGDFYRGGVNLKEADNKGTITGIPFTALTADVSKVDITKAGTYPVVYTYTNPSNSKDTASITVPVTVSDSSAPVFSFQGTTNTTIHTGDKFDINNYKVVGSWSIFNNYGGDYNKLPNFEGIAKNADGTPKVTVTGIVDTHKPGIYQLTYKATSVSGAVTEMVRNITVLPSNGSITTPSTDDWNINAYKAVGYINYVPGYGIMVYNAPAGAGTGQRLAHGTAWKISQRAVNAKGETFYRVGDNQWINGKYVTFSPINTVTPLRGEVMIVYKKGYGVNLWKSASTTNGYYPGRKLMHGSRWKVSGKQNGFYKVGKDQWIQGDYAGFRSY
ncbi:immunoglobulin-like domain-containing protein [Xylocopilactobacillus apis]|uniref:Pesticidal crystal protein Cry22Aa Ig-like domain-containing protein n=1 Tax=Xylocopilactobacillus apis TaxID=2932183 RepID=A0AAU9D7S9_9LACO|nr:immunoglobulin-like domain-containing protein [Xylocopilactobacillus apis]BDR56837.1 hypothetical protein KIMC2_13990 [Xylocopilactobacillus apis]